ncbi:MAG: phosphatase PAP2 family protein [Ruminiclostridium sp.]|nr:phosphatase PAP2 family protein [Ruminiclostridium sp.]
MKRKNLCTACGCLAGFLLWTVLVSRVDVQAIGPKGSPVGLAGINGWFHGLTGVHMTLYTITDWLGLIPLAVVLGFSLLGLFQWIIRKRIVKVDRSILVLGVYYLVVLGCFLFFEEWVVNYRPVLIDGVLEASYPSSTTLLVMCVMPTAMMELGGKIKHPGIRRWVILAMSIFTAFMVMGRLVSGVHWLTDIVGGVLLSAGLVLLYRSFKE